MSALAPEPAPELDVHEVEDGLVVYDLTNDRVHYLNPTASLVFALCDGEHDVEEIAEMVRAAWELPDRPEAEVLACLEQLRDEGVIR
jgi:hypothetical protein